MEDGRLVRHDAGRPDFLQHKRRVTGSRALAVPTLAERLTDSGGAIIFSKRFRREPPMRTIRMDLGGSIIAPDRSAATASRCRENEQLRVTLDVEGDRAMTERFIREAVVAPV